MRKEFYEKPLFIISNYLFNFIQNTLYFSICNILLILFFIITWKAPTSFSFILLFIALIPLGPSLTSLYYCMSKLIDEKDIYSYSYFWSFLKKNFLSALKIWIIELIILLIFIADLQFFYLNMPESKLHIIFALLIILAISISFYTLCINSMFVFSLKDTFLLSALYMTKKLPITIMKFIILYLSFSVVNNFSLILLPFTPGIICMLFFFYDKNTINEIKNKFTSSCVNQ